MADFNFKNFLTEVRQVIGLSEDASLPFMQCMVCCFDFETSGDKLPKLLNCCKQDICVSCEKRHMADELLKTGDNVKYIPLCPLCRTALCGSEVDEKCLKAMDDILVVEPKGITCSICRKNARKPHHRFVCMTCCAQTGQRLLSGQESDRQKIKEETLCINCTYRHSLYHNNQKKEKNAVIPLSHIFMYTEAQVETASDAIQLRVKNGYTPSSLCIIYSLWMETTRGHRLTIPMINRLIEVMHEAKKSVIGDVHKVPLTEALKKAATTELRFLFPRIVADLTKWCNETLKREEGVVEADAEWAESAAQLIFTSIEYMDNLVPIFKYDCWTHYGLLELVLKFLPFVVRRFAVGNFWRHKTIWSLYHTCKYIELSWEDLACGRLLMREMACMRVELAKETSTKRIQMLTVFLDKYQNKCAEHDKWREEEDAKKADVAKVEN